MYIYFFESLFRDSLRVWKANSKVTQIWDHELDYRSCVCARVVELWLPVFCSLIDWYCMIQYVWGWNTAQTLSQSSFSHIKGQQRSSGHKVKKKQKNNAGFNISIDTCSAFTCELFHLCICKAKAGRASAALWQTRSVGELLKTVLLSFVGVMQDRCVHWRPFSRGSGGITADRLSSLHWCVLFHISQWITLSLFFFYLLPFDPIFFSWQSQSAHQ